MEEKEINSELSEDLEMIQRYKDTKDLKEINPFFQKYMGMIYGVCLKYLREEEASKDAVMDIYEKLTKKLLTHNVKIPKSWLYTLSKNHCYEKLRTKTRHFDKETQANLVYSEEVYRPTDVEWKEKALNTLEDCISKLEQYQQKCIRLFYLEKNTYKEVCEIMDISWSRARSLIQNGRRNLKKCMQGNYEPEE